MEELFVKIHELQNKDILELVNLKNNTRNKFLNGKVCNQTEYMINLQQLLIDVYNKHVDL